MVVLSGSATLRIEGEPDVIALAAGETACSFRCMLRHRVEWTDPAVSTVRLALHYLP